MVYKKDFICATEEETRFLAESFAKLSKKGDVFALFGTLGVGKSTFSRYFIQYLTNATDVPSPTFTLLQTYEASSFDIYHYDLYRLKKAEEAYELDIENAFYNSVCLIEWPEKILSLLPKNIWKTKGQKRLFEVETCDDLKYQRLKELNFD